MSFPEKCKGLLGILRAVGVVEGASSAEARRKIQCLVYILQELGLETHETFVHIVKGPHSEQLEEKIEELFRRKILELCAVPGGVQVVMTKAGRACADACASDLCAFQDLAKALVSCSVRELEKQARELDFQKRTALYLGSVTGLKGEWRSCSPILN